MISSRTKSMSRNPKKSWASALRSPWTVACATAVVVLGPSAVTASALERANSAPLHGASAPERPHPGKGHHSADPYAAAQYAYLPRTTNRGLRV
ncbi:hypothetical protein Sipo8835_31390 [Streptomyces ipomoeae]|jgi:hypothetical protein|uniref:Uncharacterized protein n=2 Tax=Streptomyces ipomoeae TaxID=103232 RepID=L1KRR6_9ACTN|nr:hypothetical protein [Streptomyces ipomoeae]EKX63244.1 hypothetical protein STRIP9103_02418 [Streptomyces ipomoeae 91-03]MDX2700742.1 hypothetical protein [Streptomyces ipomoeae]MDX2828431.1 hypothetical protein [Streptomyces ipomoeae]MDX2842526.1 hypothetical protein [Streptomyces ipomoeae]MDX2876929.1 hypothetical protein [Streptomyces ipomoeae]